MKHITSILFSLLLTIFFTACGGNNNTTQNTAIDKLIAYANSNGTSSTPTLQDYLDAGVVGVNDEAKLAEINQVISRLSQEDVDTTKEVQDLANSLIVEVPEGTVLTPTKPKPDTTPPVIIVTGDNALNVVQFTPYTEEGATAEDSKDGTVPVNVSGTVNTDVVGVYTLTYTAIDSAGNTATATRTVTVTIAPNTAPVANTQALVVDEDSVGNSILLTGTDAEGSVLSYILVTSPTNGTLTGSGSTRLYAPNANYAGADSFSFKVNDGTIDSATVTVDITVTNLAEPILTRRDTGLDGVCATYTDKSGEDLNFNGVLDDAEVTTTAATLFTNGEPLTLTVLKAKIAANVDVTSVNTCKITNMSYLFSGNGTFNQNISSWNTGAVTNMNAMFAVTGSFNQNIGSWDTSSVTRMKQMFFRALVFNQNIGAWDTSSVIDMEQMFNIALLFSQDLSGWDVSSVIARASFSSDSQLTNAQLPVW